MESIAITLQYFVFIWKKTTSCHFKFCGLKRQVNLAFFFLYSRFIFNFPFLSVLGCYLVWSHAIYFEVKLIHNTSVEIHFMLYIWQRLFCNKVLFKLHYHLVWCWKELISVSFISLFSAVLRILKTVKTIVRVSREKKKSHSFE